MSQVIESEDEGSSANDDEDEDEDDEPNGDAASQRSNSDDELGSHADDRSDAGSTRSRDAMDDSKSGEKAKDKDVDEAGDGKAGTTTPPPPESVRTHSPADQIAPIEYVPYDEPDFGLVDGDRGVLKDGVDFDVVLVHGLHGSKSTTWCDEGESWNTWNKTLIKDDLFGYWTIRELYYWYETNWESTHIYFPDGINEEAQKLVDELVEARKGLDTEKSRPIVFIGHDIGGLIVKKALVIAASNAAKYGNIPWETSTLIFLSVPNRIRELERLEDELIDLISTDTTIPGLVRKASQLARDIRTVNAEFLDTNMLLRASIFSVYCRYNRDLATENETTGSPFPFNRFTAVFETPFEFCCHTYRSHKNITRKPAKGDSDWPLEIKRVINELPFYTNINDSIARPSKRLLSSTPPIYPYSGRDYHEDLYSWFIDHDMCNEWLASNRGLSIMHVHHQVEEADNSASQAIGASRAVGMSQAIFTCLYTYLKDHPSKGENWVCYFRFDKTDARYRDIKAMLITFLTMIISRFSFDVGSAAEGMEDFDRNVNVSDLVDIFQGFMGLRDNYNTEKITFCVGCFDQCEEESRNWFLRELIRLGSLKESRDKWLFDSSDADFLKAEEVPSGGIWRINAADAATWRPRSPSSNSQASVGVRGVSPVPEPDAAVAGSVVGDGNTQKGGDTVVDGPDIHPDAESKKDDAEAPAADQVSRAEGDILIKIPQNPSEPPATDDDPVAGEETLPSEVDDAEAPAADQNTSEPPAADDDPAAGEGTLPSEVDDGVPVPAMSSRILRVLDDRPVLHHIKEELKALVCQHKGETTKPACAVLDWLFRKSQHATMATVEALVARPKSLGPDEVFRSMLDFVDQEIQSQAHRLVTLLRHTLRPLSSHEAAVALTAMAHPRATLTDADVAGIIDPLLHNFPGVFELRGQEIFVWSLFEPLSQEMDSKAHGAMAELCLQYLLQPDVHPLIEEHSDNVAKVSWVAFEPRRDFVSYAARYWLDHYRLAGSDAPKEYAYSFFGDEKASRSWREAAISRMMFGFPLRHYFSPIPQIASTGLDDLLDRRLEEDKNSATFSADCDLALSEAASSNHSSVVALLIERRDPSPGALKDAFRFAAGDGCDAVVEVLIEYASRDGNAAKVEWPDNLLSQLSDLGRHDHLRRLLALGLSPDPKDSHTMEPYFPSPLSVALSGPHLEATKVLVDAKADILAVGKKGARPLTVACLVGDPEIVRLLIEKGAEIEAQDENGVTALQGATDWGRLKAVEVMLEHGADHSYGQTDNKEANSTTWKPIVQASQNNYAKIVALLLSKGADANAYGPSGCALYLAARGGHIDVCKMLLENGAVANVSATEFASPLSVAVETGKLELVQLLLDHGAEVEAVFKGTGDDDTKDTPLTIAARQGLTDIVELLLERGANPNHYEGDLDPPLYLASWRGHVLIVKMLLEKGADPNAQLDGQDWTAVHAAYDNPEAMRLLLAKGGDPDRVADSSTALLLAVRWDNLGTLKAVLERSPRPNLEAEDDEHMTALCRACQSSSDDAPEMIRALLDEGADPNHGAGTDNLPLHHCLRQEACLQALLESRPQLDVKDSQGDSALHLIQLHATANVLRKLVMGGADIEAVNNGGLTPLAKAVKSPFTDESVLYLIKKGAQPNLTAPGFEGILHEAVRNCDLPVLKALVKAGADINALSGETGSSILYLIARYLSSSMTGTRETLEYFVEELGLPVNIYGGPLGWPLTAAAHRPGVAFEYLLEHGANTEVEDSIGRRPTHVAAIGLDFGPALRSLISRGASVLASDKMGLLPVHYAAHGGHPEQLQVLLDQPGVLVNAPDADGWTPLMWACTNRQFPVERINLLIAKGADIWARGDGWDHQWSPLRLARFNGLDAEVQALLQPGSAAQESEGFEPERVWDEEFHQIEEGNWLHGECFACMSDMSGKRWRCISCPAEYPVEICFKCYRYKEMIHGQHEFKEEGFEFEHERLKSLEAAGANTPFGDHGDNASGSFSDDGDIEVRTTRRDRRASRSSNSDSRSDSSIGIEDEDSDEGLNEDESSGDEK
ncbi:hypothetical protein VDGD_06119 [Verticillium dahliae]|nr:hypothetical protein VdG1_02550 [Verticillium dahliae VDG1]RBQ98227.1 hypothetical protein VDGD_06119 [Verticillium dahliae]